MVNLGNKLSFGNGLRGSTLQGSGGASFDFYPTIGFTAKKLFELEASIKSFRVPLEQSVREVIRPSIAENFKVGGRPQWAPLAASTVKRKGHARVNVDSNRLAKVAAQRNIWDIGMHTATIPGGALIERVPYALYVQAGHNNKDTKDKTSAAKKLGIDVAAAGITSTPARPYLMIQPEDVEKIKFIFGEWIDMRIAKAWGR